ncbi:DUF6048 family protein [Christiangramia forsetii]|uniref:Secreted protein n=2 Tax=Christiangramia forsetii TaxID=411153 RepID=A0M2L4_CHRFK|nr:DUF6048 family protein [Christiangramia forsetii]GGG38768.1 hypothetical protein GCM10011532_23220 [Christiangramia forsetii]CAL66859.1 conserved hypothetical protein, secreted [Christiangramia forsetii KT0803]
MYRYFSSLLFILLFGLSVSAQQQEATQDTVQYNEKYGVRVGIDLSKPLRTLLDDNFSGIQLVGDYRVYKNFYAAAELGTEKITFEGDNIETFTNGSYIKLGGDYNAYENWLDMQNAIFVGVRFGFASFSQTLDQYRIYTSSNYFGPDIREDNTETTGLTASWGEVMIGIKVEIIKNLFLSANVQLKRRIGQNTPTNFDNLAIPGFGRTYDSSEFGAGFGYNISYLIPFYKKSRN